MNFSFVIKKLQENNIPFYVTGSFAVQLYTGKRNPNDYDIVVKREDLSRIEEIFSVKANYGVTEKNETYKYFRFGNVEIGIFDNYLHNNKVLSFEFNGRSYKNYRKFEYEGMEFKVIDPIELIIIKLIQDRNNFFKQDREDVRLLIQHCRISVFKLVYSAIKFRVFRRLIDTQLTRINGFISNVIPSN